MMMVGALQCRTSDQASHDAYNAFIARQHGVLDSKAYVLKGHFLRENGLQSGRAAYDEYNTAMSNRHAGRFDDPSFCGTIATYTRLAATSSDHDFIVLAQAVIEPPASSCTEGFAAAVPIPPRRFAQVPAVAVASEGDDDPYHGVPVPDTFAAAPLPARETFAPAPQPSPEVVPAVAYAAPAPEMPAAPMAAPFVTPAPAPVAVAAPPVPVRTAAAMPTSVIAAAPVVPPQEARAAPSPADALQAAISALQAATDALKASQAHPTN